MNKQLEEKAHMELAIEFSRLPLPTRNNLQSWLAKQTKQINPDDSISVVYTQYLAEAKDKCEAAMLASDKAMSLLTPPKLRLV